MKHEPLYKFKIKYIFILPQMMNILWKFQTMQHVLAEVFSNFNAFVFIVSTKKLAPCTMKLMSYNLVRNH